MFKFFIKTTFRSFKKFNRNFIINTLGLSIAFVCCILLALWIKDEYSVDRFHENDNHIYQVMMNYDNGGDIYTFEWTPAPLSDAIANEIPNVAHSTNVYSFSNEGIIVSYEAVSMRTNEIYAGKEFFDMFSFNILQGNKDKLLDEINAVAISEVLAKNLFGTADDAVGKTIKFNQEELSGLYTVSGVFATVPKNSTIQFNAVFSFDNVINKLPEMNKWEANEPFTFVSLPANVDIEKFNTDLTKLVSNRSTAKNLPSVFVRPFSERYLYNNYENGVQSGGRITYINLFSLIGLFILIIASINFMNLSTAQAADRIKEIGVRKVLGAERRSLIAQFLGESLVISFLALCVAVGTVVLILPNFNILINQNISLDFEFSTILSIIFIVIITGLLSGIYPALYLSGFKTIKLLKGKFNAKGSEKRIRQGLVIFQFTVSVMFIVAVIVITNQIELIQNKELGYNKEQVVVFRKDGKVTTNLESFLTDVNTIPGVLKTSSASLDHLTNNSTGTRNVVWDGKEESNDIAFKYILANQGFIELLDIEIKEGRSFSKNLDAEKDKVILNETAVALMKINDPLGKTLKIWGANTQIIGVVNDFHFQSLHEKIQPLFMKVSSKGEHVMIKIAAGSERETIGKIEELYKSFNYGLALDFRFLDSDYQSFYEAESRFAVLSKYFGALAILLSCLGLFGLVTFNVSQRYKEIGVRKVLGSSSSKIAILLSKDFLKLIIISIFLALPMSWYLMNNWLQDFAYRVEMDYWVFISAGLITTIIAITIIGLQTVRAASVNPIESLKTE